MKRPTAALRFPPAIPLKDCAGDDFDSIVLEVFGPQGHKFKNGGLVLTAEQAQKLEEKTGVTRNFWLKFDKLWHEYSSNREENKEHIII